MFRKVTFSTDERTVGKDGFPFEVRLPSIVWKYINRNYPYKSYRTYVDNMPRDFQAHLLRRKRTIDYMDSDSVCAGVLSEKFKNLLEEIKVSHEEYDLIPMRIDDFEEVFYLMLVPIHNYDIINFKDSVFTNYDPDEDDGIFYYKFDSYQAFLESSKDCRNPYELVLDKKYEKYDILKFNYAGMFFSPRLQEAIVENGILGVDYYGRRSDFYVKLTIK